MGSLVGGLQYFVGWVGEGRGKARVAESEQSVENHQMFNVQCTHIVN